MDGQCPFQGVGEPYLDHIPHVGPDHQRLYTLCGLGRRHLKILLCLLADILRILL